LLYSGQDVRTNLWLIENARDVQYPDKETEELLKERDRKRLREMTFYCSTKDCLRNYILKYFGENPPNYCGNCGNCATNFEMTDITLEAQKILSCVARMRERYGQKMLIDVLRGSKSEKVMRLELDKLSTYGISEKSEKQLHEIINQLILMGYLIKTDDEYPVIKLGNSASEVLRNGKTVEMKLSKTEIVINKKQTRPVDKGLFAVLRELRFEIAKEQNVPAFVIFPDSTLTDMCMKIPKTNEEFLNVSGVGQVKLERYGERFLKAIADNCVELKPQEVRVFEVSSIEISNEPVTVSVIADKINCVLMESGYEKISGMRINDWLASKGYMSVVNENGKNFKMPTDSGTELGIVSEERVIRGENVKINLYGKAAQEFIAGNALAVVRFKKG